MEWIKKILERNRVYTAEEYNKVTGESIQPLYKYDAELRFTINQWNKIKGVFEKSHQKHIENLKIHIQIGIQNMEFDKLCIICDLINKLKKQPENLPIDPLPGTLVE